MSPEKRRFKRWQMSHPSSLRFEGAFADVKCNILDLSLKGLQISLPLKLDKDKFLSMRVNLSSEIILNVEVWVAWHKVKREGQNVYGLYFTKITDSDKEKIYQFICKFYPGHIKQQICGTFEKGGEDMPEKRIEDRRIFDRFPARLPVRFLDTFSNFEGKAETADISAKGLRLVTSENLAPRSPLEVWLEIPDKGEPLYARGEVVWSRNVEPSMYHVGINLEKADLMGLSRVLRAA